MSGTPHIRSFALAPEASFGSLSASTGLPDASGLTFVVTECERAPVIVYGEPPVDERNEVRAAPYELPPEPDTVCDVNGDPVPRRTGQATIDMVVTGIGNPRVAFATISDMPVAMLWNACMAVATAPGADHDVVTTVAANVLIPEADANYTEGILIATSHAGTAEYTAVVEVDAVTPDIRISPALSAGLAAVGGPTTQDFRIMQTYYVRKDLAGLGASLACRADGIGWRTYGVGGRPSSVAISASPHLVRLSWTVDFAHFYDDFNDASVTAGTNVGDPVIADGCVNHMLATYTVVTTAAVNGIAAPAASGHSTILVDEFDATLTFALASKGSSESILAMADYEVSNFTAEINITASEPSSALSQDTFYKRQLHGLLVGLGSVSLDPTKANTGGGDGMCIYAPAAALFTDPHVLELGGDIIRTTYQFKQGGPWTGDDATSGPAGSVFRVGLSN